MAYEKLYSNAVSLYKNELVETMFKRSFESGENMKKENFANWVRRTYEDLVRIPEAKAIIELACTSAVEIIYTPDKSKLTDTECGLTIPEEGKIFIAAGNYEFENHHNCLKGLIIHELVHYTVYEIFCNDGNPFYFTDIFWKECWNLAAQECFSRSSEQFLNKDILNNYPPEKYLPELVARCFQYHIEFFNNKEKINKFSENFPTLLRICREYVWPNIETELVKISAISNINHLFFQTYDLRYDEYFLNFRASTKDPFHFDNILKFGDLSTKILETDINRLAVNYIYHQVYLTRRYKRVQYVFLESRYLLREENSRMFIDATQRKVPCLFIIDFNKNESYELPDILLKLQQFDTKSKFIIIIDDDEVLNQFGTVDYSIRFFFLHRSTKSSAEIENYTH